MTGFKIFRCSCENIQNILISLMDESLYFAHTRNYKQEAIYYTQGIKTIFKKFFTLIEIYNGFWSFLREKRQIKLTSNVPRVNNK